MYKRQDLVGTDAEVAIAQRAGALGRHLDGLADPVQDDEIVARAMHFGEVPVHGEIIAHSGRGNRTGTGWGAA